LFQNLLNICFRLGRDLRTEIDSELLGLDLLKNTNHNFLVPMNRLLAAFDGTKTKFQGIHL